MIGKSFTVIFLFFVFGCGQEPIQSVTAIYSPASAATVVLDSVKKNEYAVLLHKISSVPVYSWKSGVIGGDSLFWKIVKRGREAVPYLIELLDSTSYSRIRTTCATTNLNIGHLAFLLINHICSFPVFLETHMQFDVILDGCPWGDGFMDYFDRDPVAFKKLAAPWYKRNNSSF
jgi:hypothetical protein